MTDYARAGQDWRSFAHFSRERYTRNLVHSCAGFELMVVCWNSEQASPIHNHAGSNCWMAVLEGEIEEVHYDAPVPASEPGAAGGSSAGPLVERRRVSMEAGRVAFIRDEIALHLVRARTERPSVSLHLYAGPIETCQIYCPETGRIEQRQLCFHSIDGVLVGS